MNLQETVFALCTAEGVTGRESAAAQLSCELLRPYAADAAIDGLGSVTGTLGSGCKTILLDAHLDQIALVVTTVEERGFVRVAKVGGIDRRVMIGKPVVIYGRKPIHAIVSSIPPHLATKEDEKLPELAEMMIDTGLSETEAKEWIAPGDPILLDYAPQALLGTQVTAPALDDRCAIAAILRCLELLQGEELPCKIAVQFSVHEETNSAGAKTSAFRAEAEEALIVDVSFAKTADTPGEIRAKLGSGTMIGYSPALCREISQTLCRLAKEQQIPHQAEAMGGRTGTNADDIAVTRDGVAVGLLSIPQKNMHTGVEIVDLADVESTAQLMAAYIRNGGKDHG